MQKLGRLGLGGVAVLMAACGGNVVGVVGRVDGGAGSEDTGGGAGSGGSDVNRAGGGSTEVSAASCKGCELVLSAANVHQFAANAKTVCWIERGTNNEFEEYQGDGRLMARDLDSGEVSTLARELYRPDYLGVSARYAYVFLNNDGHQVLRRYPLDSVDATTVEDVAPYYSSSDFSFERTAFAATQDFSYFQIGKQLHRIAETPGAEEELVASDDQLRSITADDTGVYFGSDSTLYIVDAPGVAPRRWADLPRVDYLSIVDGYFYVPESGYFSRLPAAGGAWKRFADGGNGLQVLGDYFYTLQEAGSINRAIIQRGALSAPADRAELASYAHANVEASGRLWPWLATRTGVYLASDRAVYFAPSP